VIAAHAMPEEPYIIRTIALSLSLEINKR